MIHAEHILALARAGATAQAWEAFGAAGYHNVAEDPKILTLKGRLLKDRARKAPEAASAQLFLQSAKAYADAAALQPDSYPLINAATMAFFAGQSDRVESLAQQVLTMLETGTGVGETPYWHEATRAEALLLLERRADAQAALNRAIAAAPAAWEDRAATLRQFRQINEFRRETSDWLKDYAPPCSLYFKGMIGIASDDSRAAELAHQAVRSAGAGFGYGALAAGADILIAEALVATGAELHLILPTLPSAFRTQSVAPFGDAWLPRFDRLLEQAASVTIVATEEILTASAIDFAALAAKGAAIENAARLEGQARGLEITDSLSPISDAQRDLFVLLDRSDPHPPTSLETGNFVVTLISDSVGSDSSDWRPIAEGYYASSPDSLVDGYDVLRRLRHDAPDACCAFGISVTQDNGDRDVPMAKYLRLAQCATAGLSVTDSASALALLSLVPKLLIEPLGELPDSSGAVGIYAILPET